MAFALSILDLSPISSASTSAQALHNSIQLAQLADRLGYTRYWLAEHHNVPSIAISVPEILIGIIARETTQIRVGSGGIMLPNHAPLHVAEAFRTLEALYPGRIDLGIGRALGTECWKANPPSPMTRSTPCPMSSASPTSVRPPSKPAAPCGNWRLRTCSLSLPVSGPRRRSTRKCWGNQRHVTQLTVQQKQGMPNQSNFS